MTNIKIKILNGKIE